MGRMEEMEGEGRWVTAEELGLWRSNLAELLRALDETARRLRRMEEQAARMRQWLDSMVATQMARVERGSPGIERGLQDGDG